MRQNPYITRYRQESIVLGNRNATFMNSPVISGNPDNLKSHLLQIKGGGDGRFYDPQNRRFIPSRIEVLKEQLQALTEEEKKWHQNQANFGNAPGSLPAKMQEQRQKIEAHLEVCQMEISWLEDKLEEATKESRRQDEQECLPPNPQLKWGICELKDGILHRIGGQLVGPGEDGVLEIIDERSRYMGMPVLAI